MIDHSNLEDYADPALCDLEGGDHFEPDGPFYLSLATQVEGPILDLGYGTGRISIPMAKAGLDVVGLDVVPGMVAHARRKAGDLPIQWVESDVRNFELGQQFGLIIAPGVVFEHLLVRKDQAAMLSCVHSHLRPDGLFAIAVRFPKPDLMANSDGEQFWYATTNESGQEVRVSGVDVYDAIGQIRHETAYRRWVNEDGEAVMARSRIALRFVFPQEMEGLLFYNGFEVLHRYGDWDASPLTDQSDTIIYVCRKTPS